MNEERSIPQFRNYLTFTLGLYFLSLGTPVTLGMWTTLTNLVILLAGCCIQAVGVVLELKGHVVVMTAETLDKIRRKMHIKWYI